MSGTRLLIRFLDASTHRWGELLGKAPVAGADMVDVVPFDTAASTTGELITALDRNALKPLDRVQIVAPQRE